MRGNDEYSGARTRNYQESDACYAIVTGDGIFSLIEVTSSRIAVNLKGP